MKIILCSDHAGFELKQELKQYLTSKNLNIVDVGAEKIDSNDSYVGYAKKANRMMVEDIQNLGIYVCGSGVGMCIVANKQKGVRATNVNSVEIAKLSKQHNNANVLCLGARFIDSDTAKQIVDAFLSTQFLGGKHKQRVDSIE